MNIGLDYDGTYTRDKELWDRVISMFREKGHKIYVVTMRHDSQFEAQDVLDDLSGKVDGFFFTGRMAKQPFMFKRMISIDIWIDDNPLWINNNAMM